MKRFLGILLFFFAFYQLSSAQSAVFIYKNVQDGKGDFMSVRSMPNQLDAEFMAKQKLMELVNDDLMLIKSSATGKKGHGVIVMATLRLGSGKSMNIYGSGLGFTSEQLATQAAVTNLKRLNPEWTTGKYTIIQKFKD